LTRDGPAEGPAKVARDRRPKADTVAASSRLIDSPDPVFSPISRTRNLARLCESGFDVWRAEVVTQIELGREVGLLWVLARRTGS
jgi:hypothetical protein